MRLKTYLVDSLPEAMAQIKKDLGEDALILNTKKVKSHGFFGLFKKEKLEIIAAVDTKQKFKHRDQSKRELKHESEERVASTISIPSVVKEDLPLNIPSEVDQNLTRDLMNELKNIKKMMVQVIEEDRLPESMKKVNKQFINQEITPEIRSELLAKLMVVLDQNQGSANGEIYALARNEIIKLVTAQQKIPENKTRDIICFVGPTGVGKTTTIAKIAADYILNGDKKVGLITSDTYRIAAIEQLKTYASILNIPIKIVQSPFEVKNKMSELSSCDIILMDTAGRNYQQKQYINELELLLSEKQKIQVNLVLSLTSKYEDMKGIIDNFKTITIDQLILTKKDETNSYGAILNLIYDYSIPLRYITNGQNVPDDIITVTPPLIANFLLGEDEND
jgi:flagellar biosynthesis protein FlhF